MTVEISSAKADARGAWVIREFVAAQDAASLGELDTAIETRSAYGVRPTPDGLLVGEAALPGPVEKRFDIDLQAVPIEKGWVAVQDGRVRGFVGMSVEPWNMRLAIWHLYVDRAYRRQGAGHLLMAAAISWGRKSGATSAWIETSNLNAPGIRAYVALGFQICGFDTSLYRSTASQSEFAVFMSREL